MLSRQDKPLRKNILTLSLLVNIISKDDYSDVDEFESRLIPGKELFGFEQWRQKLWGNDIIKQLGCDILYSLKDQDIYAYDEQVYKLKTELNTLLKNLSQVSTITKIDDETIKARIQNALTVIQIVEKNLDKIGVVIW